MEDQQLQSHSSMPLLSRVDRLDSVITYIEKKEKLSRWRKCSGNSIGKKERKGMAPKVATQDREAHSKGSLVDRILSLEDRLVQLSQEIESSSRASSSGCSIQSTSLWTNTNTTATSSSCGGSKTELSLCSYPTFTFPINPQRKPESEFQKIQHTLQHQRLKHPSDHTKNQQQQQQKGKDGEEEKACKSCGKKKKRPLSWPRIKLLGC